MRRKPLMDMSQDLMESPLKKGEAHMQPHPLGGLLPTPTHLKGLRIKPTACHRSFRLKWWSGWHRSVLRRFAGGVWVLLALSAKRPCPQSKCRSMGIPPANGSDQNSGEGVYMALMGIPGEDFRLCLPAAPSLTPIRLRGLQIKPTTCRHFSPFTWSCAPHDHVKAMKRWQICSRLYASGQRVSMGLPPASITGVCGGGILPEHG